ncbi:MULTISPECIES: fimbrial protein [Stenotrophomonas]|uniref:fimbrial protein n=1 Tax=Stenotrophomonas TaxID=40323 RepID=UPI002E760998|nr:hypothetical protein [[Pseudomonas] hibiscicola]
MRRIGSRGRGAAIAMMVAGCSVAPTAYACKMSVGQAINGITVSVPNDARPDVVILPFRQTLRTTSLKDCADDPSFPITLTPASAGLIYVRNVQIDGTSYPAYGWHANSPLIAFRYRLANSFGEMSSGPLNMERSTDVAGWASGYLFMSVEMAILSRGGRMTGVGRVSMGAVGTTFPKFPALQLTNELAGDVEMERETCFMDAPVAALRDVSHSDLPNPGDSTAEIDVEVLMLCDALGVVDLSISDANAPGNRTDQLVPAPGSTAKGVRTQLLYRDVPLAMGAQWEFGAVQSGVDYYIPFKARYIRTSDAIGPGPIKGEAVLSVSYR